MNENESQTLRLKDTHPTYKKFDQLRRLANKLGITLSWDAATQRFEIEDSARPRQLFWLQTDLNAPGTELPMFPGVTEETVMTELSVHTRVDPSIYNDRDEDGEDY